MKLHIFNPEHDIALAANNPYFTAPHAGRQMRADLGFLPALWADDGDIVVVDDVEAAIEAARHVRKFTHDVVFATISDLRKLPITDLPGLEIEPWGWDSTIAHQLLTACPALADHIPSADKLARIREISNRKFAAEHILPPLLRTGHGVTGRSRHCATFDEAVREMRANGKSVVKSPWSSSGRGVRYVPEAEPGEHLAGWMRNTIKQQGGIMVEPLYPKVCDFGMEFCARADGRVEFCGLSLFDTRNGAYNGSILATEADKRKMLSRHVPLSLADDISRRLAEIMQPVLSGVYSGRFGVDMMAVARPDGKGFLLHPCVELNLRRTMGHTALAIAPTDKEPRRIMRIYFADKYRIRIQDTAENLLNTSLC